MKREQKSEFLSSRVRYIPVNTIRPNPQQPRRRFDEEGLRELAESIAEGAGVKMPSFFGYIGWALAFLIPVFIIDTLLFFL